MEAASASRMNAGVTSRGSPMPKSISSMPSAAASTFQSSRRAKGYCASSVSTGERRMRRTLPGKEPLQGVVGPFELTDLHPLVDRVRVARPAGAKVDRVESPGGEVGDVRPRLLRLHLEAADGAQLLDERRSRCDVGRRRVGEDLDVAADQLTYTLDGRFRRPVWRVAEVEDRLGARRDHVRSDARVELRAGDH